MLLLMALTVSAHTQHISQGKCARPKQGSDLFNAHVLSPQGAVTHTVKHSLQVHLLSSAVGTQPFV